MSKSKQTIVAGGGGIGFIGALTILFIALKLCGVINWHWAWVLSPLWISLLISAGLFGLVLLGVGGFLAVVLAIWLYGEYAKRNRPIPVKVRK